MLILRKADNKIYFFIFITLGLVLFIRSVSGKNIYFYAFGYMVKNNLGNIDVMIGAFYHKLRRHANHLVFYGYCSRNGPGLRNSMYRKLARNLYGIGSIFFNVYMVFHFPFKGCPRKLVAFHIIGVKMLLH